jgi:hypothetical protein
MIGFKLKFNYIKYLLMFLFVAVLALPNLVSAMSITIGISDKYSEVKPGEKVYFETVVKWPENVGRKDLRIEYSIKDIKGQEIAYLKVLKAVETQASFMDSISIPDSIQPGMYKISAKFSDYSNLDQEVVASFSVTKGNGDISTYLFVIIGLLGAILIIVIAEMYFIIRRNNRYSYK